MGVSPTKEEVQEATKAQGQGLFPGAFCKIVEDFLGDYQWCSLMHADGAGTKSSLAYIHYKEFNDPTVFRGIAQDSLIMNTDDLLCVGAVNNLVVSNTIGRNAHRVSGKALNEIISGYEDTKNMLLEHGVKMIMAGGETADLGDLVSTVIVDSTIFTRMKRASVIDCSNIYPGNVIVGLASFGQAVYEKTYNSGIASNGFTAARHLLLSQHYITKYPETFSSTLKKTQVYTGKFLIEDHLPNSEQTIGQALLSPTRTYLPVISKILKQAPLAKGIHGIIQSSGGGQVKCKKFGNSLHYIKDNLFDMPPIFQAIMATGKIPRKEMYQVFNMGQRLEIYCDSEIASNVIAIAKQQNIDAQIIGKVEKNNKTGNNRVTIIDEKQVFEY